MESRIRILRSMPVLIRALTGSRQCSGVVRDGEKVTHTGQAYDENDYRRLRFVGRVKEVNEQFAINLVAEEPVQEVEGRTTWCDGGNGALGHPRVYLNLDKDENAVCGYCGLRFRQKHQHH
uniref:NADH dehydrogenase [ubiquinone] iron-sulfur protein 6, mitochondrial n=1 Tax=Myxine glutinosa TaxID=7769 RepID=UPI00358EFBB8